MKSWQNFHLTTRHNTCSLAFLKSSMRASLATSAPVLVMGGWSISTCTKFACIRRNSVARMNVLFAFTRGTNARSIVNSLLTRSLRRRGALTCTTPYLSKRSRPLSQTLSLMGDSSMREEVSLMGRLEPGSLEESGRKSRLRNSHSPDRSGRTSSQAVWHHAGWHHPWRLQQLLQG